MNPIAEDILMHYGMPRRSGRYPWGSGEDPYQHGRDFLGRVDELRKEGFTFTDEKGKKWTGDTAIAKSMGLSTTQFRTELSLAKDERRMLDVARAKSLKADGKGYTEIGREMGINESTVRSLLNEKSESKMREAKETADYLRNRIKEFESDGGVIDIGTGTERELGISKEKLKEAVYILEKEGYVQLGGRLEQVNNPGQHTTQKVIGPPGTPKDFIYNNPDKIHSIIDYKSSDDGKHFEKKFTYPESMDSKRLKIRYNEEGGLEKDGISELRRGVDDLSLGGSRYSQVRILVDGTHYLKGMAVYSDDMPDGVDVVFNTNKTKGTPMEKVLKEIKKDPDNPFGSAIKDADQGGQYWYDDPKTGKRKLGLINKRADEGDWTEWKDALPSQFLGKQSLSMAKKQLNLAKADKLEEFDAICQLNNPTIKKHLLTKFADTCDSAAVHLQAAALPGQKYHVIIPINTLKDTEVYAPGYDPGTKLALIRYPHGGKFEIPILTVNNKNPLGDKIIGKKSIDAVGINAKVAARLSGADFDGDTVMCIPTHDKSGKVKIASVDPYKDKYLKELTDFDPKTKYAVDRIVKDADGTKHGYIGNREVRLMKNTGTQMGVISNLITDMTLAGASNEELARAVKHSMTVIDAEKHSLDYKQSEIDNNIAALHKKYQGKSTGGAATILSRAKGQASVDKRQGTPKVNIKGKEWYDPTRPEGSLIYKPADDLTYTYSKVNKKTGEITEVTKKRTQKSTKMAETDDAYSLVSTARHPMELVYADYANSMKSLANKSRLEIARTGDIKYNANAAKIYANEVNALQSKVNTALLNAPRERLAQRMAYAEVKYKKEADPNLKPSDIKKAGALATAKYRQEAGSVARRDRSINITDREWEAIQAGAISPTKLKKILDNTDVDVLRQRATPRNTTKLSTAKVNKIKQMSNSNYTLEQIAKACGCSTSAVQNYLKGAN
jgi:DNA-binding CsgD family transcriptional regulator